MASFGNKVVFVMGATGAGKSRLAIQLATHFGGEVVNSDKMQFHRGLDVVTNKVTDEEYAGVPHHLLSFLSPDADFSATDFRLAATQAVELILRRGRLPVVAGGSNSFIEELVEGKEGEFRRRFACCFLWVDVSLPVLHQFVGERVDRMVERGLVDEVREVFEAEVEDYSQGIRRSIGVPELDAYIRAEAAGQDEAEMVWLLAAAIDEVKANTCKLICCQLEKIQRLSTLESWEVKRVDATEAFRRQGEQADAAWAVDVLQPSVAIVSKFLHQQAGVRVEPEEQQAVGSLGVDNAGVDAGIPPPSATELDVAILPPVGAAVV